MSLRLHRHMSAVALMTILFGFPLLTEAQVRRITLPEAQAQAAANPAVRAAQLSVDAARYHREAAAADYFPKVGSTFANLHFNKFLGETIQLARRNLDVPLFNKDQTLVALTVIQPVTPMLKVREAVNLARADERIAGAKLAEATANVRASVEPAYFALLIAGLRQKETASILEALRVRIQVADAGLVPSIPDLRVQTELREIEKEFSLAHDRVVELTGSLNNLLGFRLETELELVSPEPLAAEMMSLVTARQRALASNLEVVEAEQQLAKAEAAVKLSKLEYVPDVAIMAGYAYQTTTSLLPADFSFLGVVATFNVFDFGKREKTLKERKTNVELAQMNLQAVRSRVAGAVQAAYVHMEKALLTREQRRSAPVSSDYSAHAEGELVQAEWDYRVAHAQFKRVIGEQ